MSQILYNIPHQENFSREDFITAFQKKNKNETKSSGRYQFQKLLSNGDIYRSSKEYTGGFINGKYVHFLEGSWMKVNQKKEYYGRIIETMTEGKCIYHYGIGFSV